MKDLNVVEEFCNCPICKSYAIRIRRRFVDRLTSLFKQSYRYKCLNYHCYWQGNICQQNKPQTKQKFKPQNNNLLNKRQV